MLSSDKKCGYVLCLEDKIPINSTQMEDIKQMIQKTTHLCENTKQGQALGRLTKGRWIYTAKYERQHTDTREALMGEWRGLCHRTSH